MHISIYVHVCRNWCGLWNHPWIHWLPLLVFWEDSHVWCMCTCAEDIVNSAMKLCAGKWLQDTSSENRSRKLFKTRLCCEKQRKAVSVVFRPHGARELLCLVSFKSSLSNWKMNTSLRVPSHIYSPRRFCRLEKTVRNKKKLTAFPPPCSERRHL